MNHAGGVAECIFIAFRNTPCGNLILVILHM